MTCWHRTLLCWCPILQALKPHIFVSVPRLWNRIYDRVMATMREANPVKRRMFETAFAYKRAALEAGGFKGLSRLWMQCTAALSQTANIPAGRGALDRDGVAAPALLLSCFGLYCGLMTRHPLAHGMYDCMVTHICSAR